MKKCFCTTNANHYDSFTPELFFFWTLRLIIFTMLLHSVVLGCHSQSIAFSYTLNFALPCPILPLGLSFCYWFLSQLFLPGPLELHFLVNAFIDLAYTFNSENHFWVFWILLRSGLQESITLITGILPWFTSVPSDY